MEGGREEGRRKGEELYVFLSGERDSQRESVRLVNPRAGVVDLQAQNASQCYTF